MTYMHALSPSQLLDAWEKGLDQASVDRAMTLLCAACPGALRDESAKLSIGQRDALLLQLREWTFGPGLTCLVVCPNCGESLELSLRTDDLRMRSHCAMEHDSLPAEHENPWTAFKTLPDNSFQANIDGFELSFRLPNSQDLAILESRKSIAQNRQWLLERCILSAKDSKGAVCNDHLPADVLNALLDRMANLDPQANVRIGITCPQCGHAWEALFDIASFFWAEINAWAARVLDEVHLLASAYGWSEKDILAMTPKRRRSYLDRITG